MVRNILNLISVCSAGFGTIQESNTMAKFRKTNFVDAVQFLPSDPPVANPEEGFSEQPEWLLKALLTNTITMNYAGQDYIEKWGSYLRTNRIVCPTDWVVNNGNSIYVLSNAEFSVSFEAT